MERGRAYNIPFSDSLIYLPELSHTYTLGNGVQFNPLDIISHEMGIIEARYRVGDGTGVSSVTTFASCNQDSNQALGIAFAKIKSILHKPHISDFIRNNNSSYDAKLARSLGKFMNSYTKKFMRLAALRGDWRANVKVGLNINQFVDNDPWEKYKPSRIPLNIIRGLMSRKVLVPRWTYDDLSVFFLKRGASTIVLHTSQVGGNDTRIYALAPGFDGP